MESWSRGVLKDECPRPRDRSSHCQSTSLHYSITPAVLLVPGLSEHPASLNDPLLAETEIGCAVRRGTADDDVIEETHLQQSRGVSDADRQPAIRVARSRVAARMIVNEDEGVRV